MAQTDFRRNAREQAHVYTTARATISKYGSHKDAIKAFIQSYTSDDMDDSTAWGPLKYMNALQDIADKRSSTFLIDLHEFEKGCKDPEVFPALLINTQRYVQFCYEACNELMPERSSNYVDSEHFGERALDEWRESMESVQHATLPPQFKCNFQVLFTGSTGKPTAVREIRSSSVGSLVTVNCIVSRVTPVKPKIEIASYHCDTCGQDMWQVVETESFLPVSQCPTPQCRTNKTTGTISLQLRTSKMSKFQEIKVQEPATDVPAGNVPMSMTVVLAGELTRAVLPGDAVAITGVYVPFEYTGFQAMRKGSSPDLYLLAHSVTKHKRGFAEAAPDASDALLSRVIAAASSANIYELLAKSIAPEIYGHLDVKKALLLQLVGGCVRQMKDGMRIRGDIHVLLMGDPGVAKSQLLKYISVLAPRAVYTTGKGSSGVGLTASVLRDKFTKEVTLEGGALVMADKGVCCIDEFDKMEEGDRTAIHEVMEQQTVSIAKAGITTTLNARASVLAAANPAYGRYNPTKSVLQNMNLPAALLSRFDLQFLLLDRVDPERDSALAKHVGHVHRFGDIPALDFEPLEIEFIRSYIRKAREFEPEIDEDLIPEIIGQYTNLRQQERAETQANRGHHEENNKTYTTPRTLLGILRLSQALARLRFSDTVERGDFMEAVRLIIESKSSVDDTVNKDNRGPRDLSSQVWECLLQFMKRMGEDAWVSVLELEKHAQTRGFSLESVRTTLQQYSDLNVVLMNPEKTKVCVGI